MKFRPLENVSTIELVEEWNSLNKAWAYYMKQRRVFEMKSARNSLDVLERELLRRGKITELLPK